MESKVFKVGRDEISLCGQVFDWAVYDYESGFYDGQGEVITKIGDKYYQKSLGHCSCYGPEDGFPGEEFDINTILDTAPSALESAIVAKVRELVEEKEV